MLRDAKGVHVNVTVAIDTKVFVSRDICAEAVYEARDLQH